MNREIDFLVKIVKEANNITNEQFQINNKGGECDLVTSLDLKIEKYLIDKIKINYPEFDIVSEEYNENNKITENCFLLIQLMEQ